MSIGTPGTSLDDMRRQARELHAAGRLQEAIQLQVAVVDAAARSGQIQASDYHRLGVMLFVVKDFAAAAQAFEWARKQDPNYPDVSLNLGLCLILIERPSDAIVELHRAEQDGPDNLDLIDGLAHAYGKVGDLAKAKVYGERSLLAKDRLTRQPPAGFALPTHPPPPFRIDRPQENVISFSLFGSQERYLRGAVKNAIIASGLYPGWRCRYYCDETVPAPARKALSEAGAEVRMMPKPPRAADGLFWRFLVADDPTVVRFLIRDCDSVINIRERRAVDEWLTSGRFYHTMRDHAAHTDLLLAGLWGGTARLLPPLQKMLEGFGYNPITESRTADQLFLGRVVWPMIKDHILIHDRVYRVFGAKDFPPGADLPPDRHVGDNDAAFR